MTLDGRADVAANPRGRRVAVAAPLWRRVAASLVDCAIDALPLSVALLTAWGGPRSILLFLGALGSLLVTTINGVALVVRHGQSLGRRWLGIQVLDSHSMVPPSLGQVVLRGVAGGVIFGFSWHPLGFLPSFTLIVGPWPIICYAPAIADRRWHRGLNDRWAHTVVISVPRDHAAR